MDTFPLEPPRDSNPPAISTQFERSSIFQFLILRFEIYAKKKEVSTLLTTSSLLKVAYLKR